MAASPKAEFQFQSTLPQRERRKRYRKDVLIFTFQSTLPQRERQLTEAEITAFEKVSIHAPTKGATAESSRTVFCNMFQSTRPQRERRFCTIWLSTVVGFNPRSHKGSDHSGRPNKESEVRFQSTLPQRERRRGRRKILYPKGFNPRSHKGSDSNFSQNFLSIFS